MSSKVAVLGLASFFLASCSGFIPEGGPSQGAAHGSGAMAVGAPADNEQLPYLLIAPTLDIVQKIPGEPVAYGSLGHGTGRGEVRPSVGDIIQVTIFESQSGGLFTPPIQTTTVGGGGNFVNLPRQAVDARGQISVPYAGQITVVGRTTRDIQAEIEQKINKRAIEPQVIVTVVEERANAVSVLGHVKEAKVIPVNNTSLRVTDALARAGGISESETSLDIILQRGRATAKMSYSRLASDATSNVSVMPGDVIHVVRNTRGVNVLGASGKNVRVPFDIDRMSLADVIARAEGLNDQRADAASVFVVRLEDAKWLRQNGINPGNFSGSVPTVYQLPLNTPAGILLGNNFKVRDRDVVYVANASGVQARKLLELIGLVTRAVGDVTQAGRN